MIMASGIAVNLFLEANVDLVVSDKMDTSGLILPSPLSNVQEGTVSTSEKPYQYPSL